MTFMERYWKHKTIICLSVPLLIMGAIIIGYLIVPNLVYDQWIWKYYWGPVVADATPDAITATYHGVMAEEGYTFVSEITYGIILIIALYAIYKLLKKLQITIDWRFCLALMPYILFGPVTRVLEDAEYFHEPAIYWFISPLIYLQIAVYALGFLILGYYLEKLSKSKSQKTLLMYFVSLFVFVDVCYTVIWLLGVNYGAYIIHPVVFYLLSALALTPILYKSFKNQVLTTNSVIFSGGLLFLFPSLYLTARWIAGEQWATSQGVRFDVFILIFGLMTLIALAVYFISYKYKDNEKIAMYKNPLNLAMIIGHMIDGITSYVSIYDPLNMELIKYVEKHPASNFLMETWPPLFPVMKFVLIVAVIYIFDVMYREELKDHVRLVNLLKIGILILGLSPGLRDLLRVTMGV